MRFFAVISIMQIYVRQDKQKCSFLVQTDLSYATGKFLYLISGFLLWHQGIINHITVTSDVVLFWRINALAVADLIQRNVFKVKP